MNRLEATENQNSLLNSLALTAGLCVERVGLLRPTRRRIKSAEAFSGFQRLLVIRAEAGFERFEAVPQQLLRFGVLAQPAHATSRKCARSEAGRFKASLNRSLMQLQSAFIMGNVCFEVADQNRHRPMPCRCRNVTSLEETGVSMLSPTGKVANMRFFKTVSRPTAPYLA